MMKARTLALLFVLPLGACSGSAMTQGSPSAASIIETPFRIAFTVPTCLGLIPTLLPGAAASAVVPFNDNKNGSGAQYYGNGVKAACGGPYMAAGTPLW